MKTTLIAAGLALAMGSAFAAPPVVKTVPWVAGNPLIPHDTYAGKTVHLKGTCDVQGANIQYIWNFGDGAPAVTGTVSNRYAVEATHAYTGVANTIYTALLTVTNTDTGESASKPYFVRIEDQTLESEVNVAIDEGLWYLFKAATRTGSQTYWYNGPSGGTTGYYANTTASALQAFQVHGHHENQPNNPYSEAISEGLDFLFTRLYVQAMSLQGGEDPDSNGNGIGLSVNSSRPIYETGAVIDSLVASGTPDATARTGPANVVGRRYQDIVQDLVDMYAWGQVDSGGHRGGWRYNWNSESDNSAAQWGAIGMAAAERTPAHVDSNKVVLDYWASVPQWVKDRNLSWLNYSYHPAGYFGYTGTSPNNAYSTGPCGMVQLAFDGMPVTDPKWVSCENYLRNNWAGFITISRDTRHYSYYAFTKAMRLALPGPVRMLAGNLDWYGDNTQGLARVLVDRQNSAGYWAYDGWPYVGEQTAAAWNVIILSPTIFDPGAPVAVALANPNPAVVGQTIHFDGTESYHTDPNKEITKWEWDLDNDGIFEVEGPFASRAYQTLDQYPITLRVTDNGSTQKTAEAILQILVTTPPIAPTADAGGPYVWCPEAKPWFLDGTGSVNPDEGESEPNAPGDTIQEYAWELDGDNDFNDAFGPTPDVTAYFTSAGPGEYLVQLRVTDTTASSYPSSNQPDLVSVDSAEVRVADVGECDRIIDLAARAKAGKVQLTWGDMGADHYNVYRDTSQGGPYVMIGQTDSRFSTYLDLTAVNDMTYYYVVRPADALEREQSQSNEAAATPVPRDRRR